MIHCQSLLLVIHYHRTRTIAIAISNLYIVTSQGLLCKICSDTIRRAYPGKKRDEIEQLLSSNESFMAEFIESTLDLGSLVNMHPVLHDKLQVSHTGTCHCMLMYMYIHTTSYFVFLCNSLPFSGRTAFCEELTDKLRGGNCRLKKRTKTIKKQDTSGVVSKLEGDFMALDRYEKDWRLGWITGIHSGGKRHVICWLVVCVLPAATVMNHFIPADSADKPYRFRTIRTSDPDHTGDHWNIATIASTVYRLPSTCFCFRSLVM